MEFGVHFILIMASKPDCQTYHIHKSVTDKQNSLQYLNRFPIYFFVHLTRLIQLHNSHCETKVSFFAVSISNSIISYEQSRGYCLDFYQIYLTDVPHPVN